MLNKLEDYWIDDTPSLADIEEAFQIVRDTNIVIRLNWCFPYSGSYTRFINKEIIDYMTPKEFFDKLIPHIYGL